MNKSRIARLREALNSDSLDAFLVSSPQNIRYLSGFTGSHALCIVTPREAHFVTDGRYAQQSKGEIKGFRRTITVASLLEGTVRKQLLNGCRRVGFESHHLSFAQYRALKRALPGVSFVPTSEVIEKIALVKDPDEIRAMRKAIAISDRTFLEILPQIRAGIREVDIAAEISFRQRSLGAERDAFDPIVASGKRGCEPHARPSKKRLRSGECVTLDFGAVVQGYHSDLTRTIALGSLSRRWREMYTTVLDAQRVAIAGAKGGMRAKDLDAIARRRVRVAGYGRYFIHGLGHGIGHRLHERPRISALSADVLEAGSVVTIEPGVYITDMGGVRIEDEVLLTTAGCRLLTHAPKELIIL
jgi:Xaa-Pro aminopeptidase